MIYSYDRLRRTQQETFWLHVSSFALGTQSFSQTAHQWSAVATSSSRHEQNLSPLTSLPHKAQHWPSQSCESAEWSQEGQSSLKAMAASRAPHRNSAPFVGTG